MLFSALPSSASVVLFASDAVRTYLLAFEQLSPNVWKTWMILTSKRLLVDIFLPHRFSKSLHYLRLRALISSPVSMHFTEVHLFLSIRVNNVVPIPGTGCNAAIWLISA